MFESFNDKMLMNHGICNNTKISVLAIGFVIAGHTFASHESFAQQIFFAVTGIEY
ncbi:MAG: hypothetical protein R3A12_17845 [Ignavibacteria bacterium]